MKSLADALPPEIAQQINPGWRKNEAGYWAVRNQLLGQYQGQWIGFADGVVIASGTSPVAVFHAAEDSGQAPFVTCVGREDEPCRMRRTNYSYDGSYPGEPLPILALEFRPVSGTPGPTLDRVIADTGADASALPWADCQALQLTAAQGRPGWMSGVAGGAAPTLHFRVWVYLDGQERLCRLQADFIGNERILGRDVLNRLEVLFRGPSGELVVSPYEGTTWERPPSPVTKRKTMERRQFFLDGPSTRAVFCRSLGPPGPAPSWFGRRPQPVEMGPSKRLAR